jgi:methionyl aminopeptidase
MFGRRNAIEIKSAQELAVMREAGLVVARTLAAITSAARPGVTTGELDSLARDCLSDHGAKSSFLGYRAHGTIPYPGVICASVNSEVVHGIPGDLVLVDGDLLSVDFGAIVDGWHGDAAVSILIGDVTPRWRRCRPSPRHRSGPG